MTRQGAGRALDVQAQTCVADEQGGGEGDLDGL
jgi:hypothetical protein